MRRPTCRLHDEVTAVSHLSDNGSVFHPGPPRSLSTARGDRQLQTRWSTTIGFSAERLELCAWTTSGSPPWTLPCNRAARGLGRAGIAGEKAPSRAGRIGAVLANRRGGHFLVGKVSFRVRRPVPRRTTMSELVSRVWS